MKKSKKSLRARGPRLERTGSDYATEDGLSDGFPPPRRIDKTIETLQAYVPGADVRLDAEQVEAQRQYLLEVAKKVKMQQRELERSRREYASATGLVPVSRLAGRLGPVGLRGKNLACRVVAYG